MSSFIEKVGGRKSFLALIGMLALVALTAFKPDAVTTEFITGLLGIIGLFGATNTIASLKAPAGQGGATTPPAATPAPQVPSHIETQVAAQQAQLNQMADIILQLTSQASSNTISTKQPERQVVSNAQANREAIGNYLSSTFGGQA